MFQKLMQPKAHFQEGHSTSHQTDQANIKCLECLPFSKLPAFNFRVFPFFVWFPLYCRMAQHVSGLRLIGQINIATNHDTSKF